MVIYTMKPIYLRSQGPSGGTLYDGPYSFHPSGGH